VYRTINYCNTVIDFAPGVLGKDNTLTQTQLNAYLAEARGLRALMYFYLVRSFRDVPLKLKSTSSDKDLEQLPKTGGDTVLAQVVSDLAYADSNAVVTFGNQGTDKGRLNKYTIKAIEADVFLWMNRYQDCENACNFIINSGKFGLIAGDGSWFNTLYYKGNSNESIFEFQYDAQKLNTFYAMFTTSRSRYLASADVMDNVFTIDYLNDNNYDIRGPGASVRTSDGAIWKYLGVTYNVIRTADASYAHWFVYRYADILLMKAEALNQMGGRGPEALSLVYKIRNRANALAGTDLNPDPTDKNAMTDFILAERAREFAFEGKRWYDILRNAKRDNYARIDILLNMVAKTVPAALQQSAIGKYHDPNSHYFPIPFSEIQADPNLIQNPFYK
ncbi:MAG TPA: RagB/SusD family nutrient uptake outer membrane protein, partial [Chitinophagaceae bacterium]|nr:RagB/SusD family nutrient uptake outer membrane protein [Chitinophagaceae bacterium]